MDRTAEKYAIIFAYFLIYVVWGSTYYFIGVALEGFPTFVLGAARFGIAGAILLMACLMRGEKVFGRRLILSSAVSGTVLLFVDMAVIMLAQRYVSSSLVAIVASSTAIWIMLLDVPMWRRNFSRASTVAGLLAGFAGVALLYLEQFFSENHALHHSEYGILILLAGCVSWAVGSLYAKYRSGKAERRDDFAGSAWQMLAAALMFVLASWATGDFASMRMDSIPIRAWAALAYLIVFGSLMAYPAYVWLLKRRPAAEVGTHAYVNPVVAVIIGGLCGEDITLFQLCGLAVILLSVMSITKHNNNK